MLQEARDALFGSIECPYEHWTPRLLAPSLEEESENKSKPQDDLHKYSDIAAEQ
jgi:hypothetical protein